MPQTADFIINGKRYMVARSAGDTGARSWEERSPSTAEVSDQMRDVARGEIPQEIRIQWSTKHRGFGEPVKRVTGRDYFGRNVDKRYAGQITLARDIATLSPGVTPGADPGRPAELGSAIYVPYGRYVLKIVPSSDTVTTAFDCETITAGTKATDLVTFKNTLCLAVGNDRAFRHSTDGSTWTGHTGGNTDFTATYFQVAENRLYRIHKGSGSVASSLTNTEGDPTSALNWAANDVIGDANVPVTGMANVAYQIFIAKEDGLYAADIETGRFPSLTPELKPWRNSANGVGTHGWGGMAFYPTIRGLKTYSAGELLSTGPEVMSHNDSEVKGRIVALAGDPNWLFASLWNGTDTYILAGRAAGPDDGYPKDFLWNVVWYISGGPYTGMAISGLTSDPRLWLFSQASIKYIKLGANLENPLQDSGAVYASSGVDYYPAHDGGSPMVDKHFLELRVYCENLDRVDGREIAWAYRLDGDTTWRELGVTPDSPVSTLKFPQGNDVVGRRISLRATWARGSTTTATPVLRHLEVLAIEFPPSRKVITANFLAADYVNLRSGQDNRLAAEIVGDLELLTERQERVTLVDPLGRQRTVLPLAPVVVREIAQQDSRDPLLIATAQYLTV